MSFKRKLLAVGLLATSATTYAASNTSPDIRLDLSWDKARASDNWDHGGGGVNAQAVFWQNKNFGVAASLGASSWEANKDSKSLSNGVTGKLKGDARLTYLGVSALQSYPLQDNLSIVGEAGLRYVMISSSVKLQYATSTDSASDGLDFDNAVTGILAADLQYKASKQLSLFAGGGSQFDVTKGNATAFGANSKNSLNSLFLRAGVQVSF